MQEWDCTSDKAFSRGNHERPPNVRGNDSSLERSLSGGLDPKGLPSAVHIQPVLLIL